MNKEYINIERIKQYLAGKLDAKAMHELEKQALDDPFLAEAMDGLLKNPEASVDALTSLPERLKNGIGQHKVMKIKKRDLRPLLAIAAILLMVIGVGYFFQMQNHSRKNITDEIVKTAAPKEIFSTDSSDKITIARPKEKPQNNVEKKKRRAEDLTGKITDTGSSRQNTIRPIDGELVRLQKRDNRALQIEPNLQMDSNRLAKVNVTGSLEGRVAGLMTKRKNRNRLFTKKENINEMSSAVRIIDAKTGNPIEGAIARYNKDLSPSVSDSLGRFIIPDSVKEMNIKAVGYVALNTPVHKNAVIPLSASSRSLNDVVVVGYSAQKNSIDSIMPVVGWQKFDDYVQHCILTRYLMGDSGIVKVGFKVNIDGTLSRFEILKGLNSKRNKQAIEILKNGSLWISKFKNNQSFTTYEIVFP